MERTLQDTLDAFETEETEETEEAGPSRNVPGTEVTGPPVRWPAPGGSRQESIDIFGEDEEVDEEVDENEDEEVDGDRGEDVDWPGPSSAVRGASRAMEGIALEMSMERVALTEAASGIIRDELLLTIAREVEVPLERLDLVDGYITDLELEGRLRRVGDVVVLARPDDGELLALDLPEDEFLERYRRRYPSSGRGVGR